MQPAADHHPTIDLTCNAGRAILGLFATIKQRVEQADGNWPGADIVDVLSEWLRGIGLDPDAPADTLPTPATSACPQDRHACGPVGAGQAGRQLVIGWPDLSIVQSRIRTWLTDKADLDELGIADDPAYPLLGIDGGGFLAHVEHLVAAASGAGLFGGDVDVSVAISSDSSGVMDGGYVFVTIPAGPREGAGGWARLASLHLDHRALIDDDTLTGLDAAASILLAVAGEARYLVTEAQRLVGCCRRDGGR